MSDTVKRFLISTGETFLASFIATLCLQLDSILSAGITRPAITAAVISALVAASKLALKSIREFLTNSDDGSAT